MSDNNAKLIAGENPVESILSIARAGLAGSQTKLNKAIINERLNQRQVLVQPSVHQYQEQLGNVQTEIKVLKASIEVLEEIIAEETAKLAA